MNQLNVVIVAANAIVRSRPAGVSWQAHADRGPLHANLRSWLNLVEAWFGIIEKQAIHPGTFGSIEDLNAKTRAFVGGWNDRCHPFVWTRQQARSSRKQTVKQLQLRSTSFLEHPRPGT